MNWLLDHVPFWAWLLIGGGAALAAWRLLGWRGVVGALAVLGAALTYREGRRDGRQTQITKDRKNADQAVRRADAARHAAAERDADPERLRDDDGWRRD